ncbi:hypothetical protein [Paenibacillus physcomitrellae]|uniref:ATPase AAA-type core domain-containing protein n=1 Tax=Paenibacillus physcomitrellae TaxID=1619311 RepID=A0ABQ1FSP6_9BACL|nr:hypothetical protein [Paenibacillus physcomitrellae]GGA29561.1 hypothetical protein GCM10010917_13230 [Paenibacillus physcomitrellae]
MSKSNRFNSSRLPTAKGMDMATVYSPKECSRKAKYIVLSPANKTIIEEFQAILAMKEQFEKHDVPVSNKIMMFGPPGTGKRRTESGRRIGVNK